VLTLLVVAWRLLGGLASWRLSEFKVGALSESFLGLCLVSEAERGGAGTATEGSSSVDPTALPPYCRLPLRTGLKKSKMVGIYLVVLVIPRVDKWTVSTPIWASSEVLLQYCAEFDAHYNRSSLYYLLRLSSTNRFKNIEEL
jgi:hypothetical protein